ncbi:MAG: hypothetical protein IKL79_02000 [Clostridia bacterium]|nr:hypothetical protein [Clostridia bacterium]
MKRKGFYGAIALLLATVAACTLLLLPVCAAGAPDSQADGTGIGIDLSRPASAHNQTLNAADVAEFFLGEGISPEEREYLQKHGGVSISADFGVTTAYVVTEYSHGTLYVRAREYVYISEDGTEVKWIPSVLRVGEDSYPVERMEEDYRASVTAELSEDAFCTVDFTLDLSVPTEEVNRLLNLAYNDLPSVRAEVEAGYAEYERLLEEYRVGSLAYTEYLSAMSQYEADFAAYTEYLSRKKIYDEKKQAYESYLAALDEYNSAVKKEEEYKALLSEYNSALAEYNEYISELEAYRLRLAEYEDYTEKISLVREQLAALDAFFLPMTDGRSAAGAINGGLVTSVLEENRDLFEGNTFKIPVCLLDDASLATRNLRLLLADYSAATTEEEKYQCYINSYEAFRDNTVLLLQSLDELYNNDKVRTGMNAKDSTYPRKYEILVAQLVIIANALNDGPVYSYWAVYHDTKCTADCTLSGHKNNRYLLNGATKIHKTSVNDILEGKDYLTDTENAEPLSGGVPETVTEPTEPTAVEKPIKPISPTVPARPVEVENPGEPPAAVEMPTEPSYVEAPTEPTAYTPPAEYVSLLSLDGAGGVQKREELSGESVFTLTANVKKSIFNVSAVTVFFYSEGGELLYATSVDSGTRADFVGDLPEKAEDDSAAYTFSHWADGEGNAADLSQVNTDLALYPAFTVNTKSYNVVFDVDGIKTVVPTPYGSLPVYDGIPTRPDDAYREYSFSGWSSQPVPVTGDAEYFATFDASYILPLGIGGAEISFGEDYVTAECRDPFTYSYDLSGVIARATEKGSARGLILNTGLFDLTFSYATLVEMKAAGDTLVTLNRTKNGEYFSAFSVTAGEGNYRVSASLPCNIARGRQLRFYSLADGEKLAAPYTLAEGGVLNAAMSCGTVYYLAEEYELSFIENPLVSLGATVGTVLRGSRVEITADIPDGISLDRLYLVYPNGEEVDIDGLSFEMPASDVTLCASASRIQYKITFMSGEKVILVRTYYYGEEVQPPPNPTRPNDATHRYYFVDWSERFTPVTEDKTYFALYEKVPLPPLEESDGLRISDGVLGLILAAAVLVLTLIFAVIPATVISLVFLSRERGKRLAKSGNLSRKREGK